MSVPSNEPPQSSMPCAFPDCARARAEGELCWGHAKQRRRGQRLTTLRDDTRSPAELLADAAIRYADAEEDEEFRAAKDLLHKHAISFAHRLAETNPAELRRLLGVQLGRPPKVTAEQVREALERAGSAEKAAGLLGVSVRTVFYAKTSCR